SLLRAHSSLSEPPGPLQAHVNLISHIVSAGSFDEICAGLIALQDHKNDWLQKAASNLLNGAPGSVRLAYTLQERSRLWSLADVFRMEYVASLHCGSEGDFQEGIRALLIDKDRSPQWNPASLEAADET